MQQNKLPEDFEKRLRRIYPDNYETIRSTFDVPRPSTFRTNTLKTNAQDLAASLTQKGFEIEEGPIKGSFILRNKSQRDLTETSEYTEGHLYIQGMSSMIPALSLSPQPGETVLDACAAPGSKTTQMAALMENRGSIIANDMSRVRLYKLSANIRTLGAKNIQTFHVPAQELWRKFPNTFDKTLVDVPCSLEGRFLSTNPKTYRDWSVKKLLKIASYQKQILHSSISATKPGGTIVYSTCTLAPEENEGVVDWVLERHGDLVTLVDTHIPEGIETAPALTSWEEKEYSPEVSNTKRIIPNELFEGFFVATFKRV
jgi:16S rRNA (cytosine1407-C5)-methyltransferase